MTRLNTYDMRAAVGRLPKDVRDMLANDSRLSVAGGYLRARVANERPNDIDIFGPDPETLEKAAKALAKKWKARLHKTDNAITVLAPGRMTAQFITRWTYPEDPVRDALISSFDFTVCQAALWWHSEVKRWKSATGEMFYQDLAARRLRYCAPQRDEDAGGSMMRVRKMIMRGYSILAPDLAGVMARLMSGVGQDDLKDLAAMDGINQEQAVKKVLTGLLREVDPLTPIDGLELAHECAEEMAPMPGEEE